MARETAPERQRIVISCGVTQVPWAPIAIACGWRDALVVARAIRRAGFRIGVRGASFNDLGRNLNVRTYGGMDRCDGYDADGAGQ